MKCHFYTILNPQHNSVGGGETTNRQIITHLGQLGFEVKVITPKTEFLDPSESDLNVLADIFNDPDGPIGWFTSNQYNELLNSKTPFIFSECAYTACTVKPYALHTSYDDNLAHFSRQFMLRAKRVLFSSPLHQSEVEKHIHYELDNAYLYLREIDTSIFNNGKKLKRNINYLFVGQPNSAKGIEEVLEKYGNQGLTIVGCASTGIASNSVQYVQYVNPKILSVIYAKSENFVHLPLWKEPFGRTVAEAALCGCNLITNENVGAMSWGLDLSNPNIYKKSGQEFQNMLKTVVPCE